MSLEEILNSKDEVEMIPGVDWVPVEMAVGEFVDMEGYTFDPLEGPEPNFTRRPLTSSEALAYSVARGWPQVAVRLNAMSELLGGVYNACRSIEGPDPEQCHYYYKFKEMTF